MEAFAIAFERSLRDSQDHVPFGTATTAPIAIARRDVNATIGGLNDIAQAPELVLQVNLVVKRTSRSLACFSVFE